MASTTTRRRSYTIRVTRTDIFRGRAIAAAVGFVGYPVVQLAWMGYQSTH